MRYLVKDLIVEGLPRPARGKGERNYIPKGSPRPCWTTESTCWCTCSGCTTLTHPTAANYAAKISRYKNLETRLLQAIKELRRRQSLLRMEGARMRRKSVKRRK